MCYHRSVTGEKEQTKFSLSFRKKPNCEFPVSPPPKKCFPSVWIQHWHSDLHAWWTHLMLHTPGKSHCWYQTEQQTPLSDGYCCVHLAILLFAPILYWKDFKKRPFLSKLLRGLGTRDHFHLRWWRFEQKGRMILGRGGNFRGIKCGISSRQCLPPGLTLWSARSSLASSTIIFAREQEITFSFSYSLGEKCHFYFWYLNMPECFNTPLYKRWRLSKHPDKQITRQRKTVVLTLAMKQQLNG